MASNEEIIQIATTFLLNAPPGEFLDVVSDVRTLLPSESLLNSTASSTFREYNTQQMHVANTSKGAQVLITKEGELNHNEYLDPKNKQIVTFDHIKQAVTNTRSIGSELDSDVEPYRSAVEEEAIRYCHEYYPHGNVAVYGSKVSEGYKVTICLASAQYNPSNFWNGKWRSVWTCTFKPNQGQVTLNAKIQINVHYYEDGNVQLNTVTEKSTTAPSGDAATTAANIIKAISKTELALHSSIDSSYTTMGETTFKALRRALPINRCKINWQKVRGFKIGSELSK
ncbi:subunit of heterodimeric actin capping protein cap32/34 [Tieghemostelium lacteum]|uniref:F-actin-capping protein subunit alpha n=1 Tax=Tieghemostelium lacteum TaxID=361077 RepID=A0A152A4V6_TIELA|nr:subunit of heterodimeric actin capping protein cap32/34 [Tieghemostelium lacteum]|eukprot:KYR01258.1 subunit of heterodimeric actin capping protein cap32/34 [Tieghemostelium lacteum]